jgi:hypothetical protein
MNRDDTTLPEKVLGVQRFSGHAASAIFRVILADEATPTSYPKLKVALIWHKAR